MNIGYPTFNVAARPILASRGSIDLVTADDCRNLMGMERSFDYTMLSPSVLLCQGLCIDILLSPARRSREDNALENRIILLVKAQLTLQVAPFNKALCVEMPPAIQSNT